MEQHIDARQIVQTLAQGLDPFSGEPLPSEHLLNHPDVAQALLAASAALEISAARVQRRAHLPENVGRQWNDAEEQELIVAFRSGKTIEEIAAQHRRSLTAIEARLEKLGLMTAEQRVTRNRFQRNDARPAAGTTPGVVQEDAPLGEWEPENAE